MLMTLALLAALGAPAQVPAPHNVAGDPNEGCCSYRRAAGDPWTCVETSKGRCEETAKQLSIPKEQWHFSKGKKCADNKDCGGAPAPAPSTK